ncbi:MAG: DUF1902 domain-containing protein [Schwartzia sp.]|nr:DUF1902 domain-containing protein [Schwartzia sp. (in: firmicutes)]
MDSRKIKDDSGLEYVVDFRWDDEGKVWIATSDDIDGLVLESESFDELMRRVMEAVPELVALNHLPVLRRFGFRSTAGKRWLLRNQTPNSSLRKEPLPYGKRLFVFVLYYSPIEKSIGETRASHATAEPSARLTSKCRNCKN